MREEDLTMNTLQDTYRKEMIPKLREELGISNPMAAPKLTKIVINCGIGAEALKDKKVIEKMRDQLALITGQRPHITRAKKAISTFKLRAGDPVGLCTTLRGRRMYDFFVRLTMVALPRVRDFRGVPKRGFDGRGNYSIGFREHIAFPEIRSDEIEVLHGLQVTIATSATNNAQGMALLKALGFPFKAN